MAKITTNNTVSFKDQKGYSRVGSIFKSASTKADLASKQARANKFTPEQNIEAQKAISRNTNTNPKESQLNSKIPGQQGEGGLYKEDQKAKKFTIGKARPKFESG